MAKKPHGARKIARYATPQDGEPLIETLLRHAEVDIWRRALAQSHGNVGAIARAFNDTRQRITTRLKALGLADEVAAAKMAGGVIVVPPPGDPNPEPDDALVDDAEV